MLKDNCAESFFDPWTYCINCHEILGVAVSFILVISVWSKHCWLFNTGLEAVLKCFGVSVGKMELIVST